MVEYTFTGVPSILSQLRTICTHSISKVKVKVVLLVYSC